MGLFDRTRMGAILTIAIFLSTPTVTGQVASADSGTPVAIPTAAVAEEISASEYCPDSQELAFLALVNEFREAHDAPPLTLSRSLGAAAEFHSREMAVANYFGHWMSDGSTWVDNIRAHGYEFATAIGENIAAGYSSAQEAFDQWANSSPHRENMLSDRFESIGIGRAHDPESTYGWYWTTTFGGETDEGPAC